MIKAIFFDFDDTIGWREKYAYDCYRAILEEFTDIQDPIEFEAVLQDCMLWDEKGNIHKDHVISMLRKTYGIEIPAENFTEYWDGRLWEHCVPFEDSYETLKALQQKYLLGLITNGPSDGQRNKLNQSGLAEFFDPDLITVSGDYPFSKPDPRIFQEACRKLDVKPEESVYVGDIFGRDVLGAYRAGMTPVWMWNRGYRQCKADVIVVHNISELLNYF